MLLITCSLALLSVQILCLDLSDIKTFTTQFTEDGKDVSVTVNVTAQTIVTKAGLALSGVTDYDGDVDTDALNLINFNGCRAWQPPIIYSGWYQAYKIMNQNKDGVTDWNEAAAIEYLGPNLINRPQQAQISSLLTDLNTMRNHWVPFTGWRLHVRCDDPDKKCPCPDGSETYALTVNKDKDSGIARINFCPAYFTMPTLNQALLHGKTNPPELALDLTQYSKNQGSVWYHELMHIDWVSKARSYGSNQHITDMNLRFQDIGGQAWESKAYNPLKAKILARYPYRTGEYVWQNADNMNMYGLAKYVQKQLGNVYPAFPAVTEENLRAPWKDVVRTQDDGKDVKWNSSNPVFKALDARSGDGVSGCNDDLDGAQVVLTMSALMPDTSYPAAYQSQLKAWASSQGTYVPPASITSTVERAQTPTGLWPACLLTASADKTFCTCDATSVSITTHTTSGKTSSYCANGSGPWGPSGFPLGPAPAQETGETTAKDTGKKTTTTAESTATTGTLTLAGCEDGYFNTVAKTCIEHCDGGKCDAVASGSGPVTVSYFCSCAGD